MAKNTQLRDYTVVRTIRQVFKVQALSRQAAIDNAGKQGEVPDVWVISEYANWNRPPSIPKGWGVIELNFTKSPKNDNAE